MKKRSYKGKKSSEAHSKEAELIADTAVRKVAKAKDDLKVA